MSLLHLYLSASTMALHLTLKWKCSLVVRSTRLATFPPCLRRCSSLMDLLDQKSLSQCLEHGPDTFKHGLKAEAGRPGLVLVCSSNCNATNLGISKEIAQAVTRKLCNLQGKPLLKMNSCNGLVSQTWEYGKTGNAPSIFE